MKLTSIIFKKELKDTLRDRRTLIFMVVMPFVFIFLILQISVKIGASLERKAQEKILKIGLIDNNNAPELKAKLFEKEKFQIKENIKKDQIEDLLKNETFDFILVFNQEFDQSVLAGKTGEVEIHYKHSTENQRAKMRIRRVINSYRDQLLDQRLQERDLEKSFVTPVSIMEHDIATMKQKIGEIAGGYIPYLFIIFSFLGAMYPAIDLAAGEKERGTIETVLVSPATRGEIVMGKFMVITLAGFATAVLSIVWLFITVKQMGELPKDILSAIMKIIGFKSMATLLSLLLPLCIFFAALLLSASVFAKSYKEAQSIIAPLNFIVIVPVFIGIFPGIKLTATTALIPILNVSLAAKDIVAGSIKTGLLIEVYLVLFLLAGLGIWFCTQWFKRESVIFRGT
jgi:sodium transport system permease protein